MIGFRKVSHADVILTPFSSIEQPRGKVLEYIARYSSKHYAALQRSGLLSRKLGHVEKPE